MVRPATATGKAAHVQAEHALAWLTGLETVRAFAKIF